METARTPKEGLSTDNVSKFVEPPISLSGSNHHDIQLGAVFVSAFLNIKKK